MYLKALNVVGFKSFADKTEVQFHRGVTAIVGPNGCGKSNVLDSIRWVLGEQSAKALRGGQMQDVIFSGSDTRKPLGMAEVSLTFGDCEHQLGTAFNEVTITRRLFRDGNSEYEINQTPCRLRDIHQLFMDTGIGRTAYSIMEQGKIDQILSARPEDRRAIFEEAAGITKYKSQKKEAMRKLEQTEANLLRLVDVIGEVRRQIGSLQRQASKARRYQELHAALQEGELRFARYQFGQLTSEINALQTQADSAQESGQALAVAVEEEEYALASLRGELEILEQETGTIREALNQARNAGERAAQRVGTAQTRVEEFTILREHCRLEIAGTEEKVRIQEEQARSLAARLESQSASRADAAAVHRQREEAVQSRQELAAEKNALRGERQSELGRRQSELANLRHQRVALEAQQHNLMARAEALREEVAAVAGRRDVAEAERAAQEMESLEAEAAWEAARAALSAAQESLAAAQPRAKDAERAEREAASAQSRLQAKLDALHQLEESHAGSPPAAQHLLACGARGEIAARLHGTLADACAVAPGYEETMALLLGDALHSLVIEDQGAAEEVLAAFARTGAQEGQVLLAPLRLARPAGPSLAAPTAARRFIEVVPSEARSPEFTEALGTLLDALLADAHVVSDLAQAWELKAVYLQAVVAVHGANGDRGALLTRGGLIQAGRPAADPLAILRRRPERLALEAELAAAQAAAQEAHEASLQAAEALQAAHAALDEARSAAKDAEITATTRRHTQQTLANSVRELDNARARSAQEQARLAAQAEEDAARHARVEEELSSGEAEAARLEEELAALQAESAALEAEAAALRQTLVESQIALATLTAECQSTEQQRASAEHRAAELRDLAATRGREAQDYTARIEQAHAEIEAATMEREEAEARSAQQETALQEVQSRRAEQQAFIAQREEGLRMQRRSLSEAQSLHASCEIKLTERRMHLTHLNERVQSAYQSVLADLPPLSEEEAATDWDVLGAEVADQRQKLDAMGSVNLDAIAEFEELSQRLTFLEGQENDLRGGKDQLLATIQEINETTKTLFAETFERIKVNFQEIFSELFGGGKATLVLADETDPLESGIEIVAKPPGKQLQSVTLLSGGEKTMTAVSLLFAIYKVKPSPFCVLDEMDAPLDESNINRFIRMVQRFTEHSQFVVITHNKRTISMADALFGVTMPERGVSKLMSIKLTAEEKAAHAGTPAPERVAAPVIPVKGEDAGPEPEAEAVPGEEDESDPALTA
ncbi:MAG: chromosome segregation protein SMC [Verrucomicrobium sp.]|nr:chromosome segregation protein SMC [Verrucomicrobium sp.]